MSTNFNWQPFFTLSEEQQRRSQLIKQVEQLLTSIRSIVIDPHLDNSERTSIENALDSLKEVSLQARDFNAKKQQLESQKLQIEATLSNLKLTIEEKPVLLNMPPWAK